MTSSHQEMCAAAAPEPPLEREEPPRLVRGEAATVEPGGPARSRHMGDGRWRAVAWLSLAVAVMVVLARTGDGVGGDTADYLALARDLRSESRFPPGLPLVLAPFTESLVVMRVLMVGVTVGLVVAVWSAAIRLGGCVAGAVCGVLLLLSPSLLARGDEVMSDRFGALLVLLAWHAVLSERHWLAGVLCGLSGWVRLVQVGSCAALPRRAWFAAGGLVLLLVAWQLVMQGHIVGYTQDAASWSPSYLMDPLWLEWEGNAASVPNVAYYPAVLLVGFGGWLCPLAGVAGILGLRCRWDPAGRFAAGVAALTLAVMLPYFHQSARLMMPAVCVLLPYAAIWLGDREVVERVALVRQHSVLRR